MSNFPITISVGEANRKGECETRALCNGRVLWVDRIDPFKEYLRQQFAREAMSKAPEDVQDSFNTDYQDYETVRDWLSDEIMRAANQPSAPPITTPVVRRLSEVEPELVEWLWPERIAIGKLTMAVGDPGLGKSFITIDIASRVSTGTPWPDRPGEVCQRGGVVILNAEDGLADTIRPRLDAAQADVERISAVQGVRYGSEPGEERAIDLTRDLPALEMAIDQTPDCRLVIVDPVTAYLGTTDSHKNAEVRAILAQLSALAERRRVAVLCISHLNKSATTPAIYRSMGSLAFTAAARSVWAVARDKDDATGQRRLFLPVKNNLGNDRTGLAYRLSSRWGNGVVPAVEWEAEPVATPADEALAPVVPKAKARKPLEEIIASKGGRITPRELMRCRRYGNVMDAEAELNELAKAGKGHWEPEPAGARGGPPVRRFVLNGCTTRTVDTVDSVDSVDTTLVFPEEFGGSVNGVNGVNAGRSVDSGEDANEPWPDLDEINAELNAAIEF